MEKSHSQLNNYPKEQVRSAIQQGIAQAEAQRSNKATGTHSRTIKNGKRKIFYAASSAAAGFAILVGSTYYSPALANSLSHVPIIGSVFGDFSFAGLQKAHEKGLANKIGETKTVNGISVTLDEVVYDQNNITVGLKIKSEKELEQFYFGAGMDSTINGENPHISSGVYGEEIQSSSVRTAIQTITVTEEMPDTFDLALTLNGQNEEQWDFSIPVKQIENTGNIPIQHSEIAGGIGLSVTELSLSETGVSLSYESFEHGTNFQLSRAGNIEFKVVDQNGNEIAGDSGGATGTLVKNRMVFKSNKQFEPLGAHVTELTITPYLALPTDGGGMEIDANGGLRELPFKRSSLQPVTFEPFKVKIPH